MQYGDVHSLCYGRFMNCHRGPRTGVGTLRGASQPPLARGAPASLGSIALSLLGHCQIVSENDHCQERQLLFLESFSGSFCWLRWLGLGLVPVPGLSSVELGFLDHRFCGGIHLTSDHPQPEHFGDELNQAPWFSGKFLPTRSIPWGLAPSHSFAWKEISKACV